MSYRFAADQEPAQEIKRVVCEQIDQGMQELTDDNMDRYKGVHQARKRFKKIRAILHLAPHELGNVYQNENQIFRALGRQLSQARDAEAMIETFNGLCDASYMRLSVAAHAGRINIPRRPRLSWSLPWPIRNKTQRFAPRCPIRA